jgi:hypothetical protein
MIRPILNINGSSAFDLIDQRRNAMDALLEAIDALKQVSRPTAATIPVTTTAASPTASPLRPTVRTARTA